jgi:hypothetical protein
VNVSWCLRVDVGKKSAEQEKTYCRCTVSFVSESNSGWVQDQEAYQLKRNTLRLSTSNGDVKENPGALCSTVSLRVSVRNPLLPRDPTVGRP